VVSAIAGAATSAGQVAVVASVYDGDTLSVRDGRRVRLLQIDTPELDSGECYSRGCEDCAPRPRAARKAGALLLSGERGRCAGAIVRTVEEQVVTSKGLLHDESLTLLTCEVLERALEGGDELAEHAVVLPQDVEELLGRCRFGKGSEAAEVREEARDVGAVSGQEPLPVFARDQICHLRRDEAREVRPPPFDCLDQARIR
jgi:hypothetical protein